MTKTTVAFAATLLLVALRPMNAADAPQTASKSGTKPKCINPARADIVLNDFEGRDLAGWTTAGDAFPPAPYRPGDRERFTKLEGIGLAWSGRGGVESRGVLLSPQFTIERSFINFLVAGARDLPARLGVELLVEGSVLRAASATEAKDPSRAMYWRTWDVRELAGRAARIRVNDQSSIGSIAVDSFSQSDEPKGLPVDASKLGRESLRPQFHYTAESGWLNDANGLLYYQGQWHLFHQHRGPDYPAIVWGHAISSDLLHWRRCPAAIQLDNGHSAASGSGMVDRTNASGLQCGEHLPLLLFYTYSPPPGSGLKKTQCLAYSTNAGRTFQQYPGNPLLRTADSTDRDPKVFYHAPGRSWFMALSLSRNNTDREHATYGIFRSADLKAWKLVQELGPGAWYWECPDLFPLRLDGDPSQTKWIFAKGSGDYIVGSFDGNRFSPEAGPIRTHWGGSFYGAQTFSDAPGGRRVQIAWMSTGKDAGPNAWPGMPFNQQMSFPRELTLRSTPEGPRLFREPVAEIAQLYRKKHQIGPRLLNPGDNPLAGVSADLLDLSFELELRQATHVKLNLRGMEILYDREAEKLKVAGRALALAPAAGKLVLRALLDCTSIELIGNRGEVTHSVIFFPDAGNHRLGLSVEGGAADLGKLAIHELKSIWANPSMDSP